MAIDLPDVGWLVWLGTAAVVVVAVARWMGRWRGGGVPEPGGWAQYARPRSYLTTKAEAAFERSLAGMLRRCGRERWRIHVQVAMSGVFDGAPERRHRNWRGPAVPPWCLDYVLAEGGRIKAIIELNDRSHRRRDRRRRDANLARGCERLGVPLRFVEEGGWGDAESWIARLE